LIESKLLIKQECVTDTEYGKHKRAVLVYNEETLQRVRLLKQWLPVSARRFDSESVKMVFKSRGQQLSG
jgi:hypothetical protein